MNNVDDYSICEEELDYCGNCERKYFGKYCTECAKYRCSNHLLLDKGFNGNCGACGYIYTKSIYGHLFPWVTESLPGVPDSSEEKLFPFLSSILLQRVYDYDFEWLYIFGPLFLQQTKEKYGEDILRKMFEIGKNHIFFWYEIPVLILLNEKFTIPKIHFITESKIGDAIKKLSLGINEISNRKLIEDAKKTERYRRETTINKNFLFSDDHFDYYLRDCLFCINHVCAYHSVFSEQDYVNRRKPILRCDPESPDSRKYDSRFEF